MVQWRPNSPNIYQVVNQTIKFCLMGLRLDSGPVLVPKPSHVGTQIGAKMNMNLKTPKNQTYGKN